MSETTDKAAVPFAPNDYDQRRLADAVYGVGGSELEAILGALFARSDWLTNIESQLVSLTEENERLRDERDEGLGHLKAVLQADDDVEAVVLGLQAKLSETEQRAAEAIQLLNDTLEHGVSRTRILAFIYGPKAQPPQP